MTNSIYQSTQGSSTTLPLTTLPYHNTHTEREVKEVEDHAMGAVLTAERTPASTAATAATAATRGRGRRRGRLRGSRAARAGAHRGGEHHVHKEVMRAASRGRRGGLTTTARGVTLRSPTALLSIGYPEYTHPVLANTAAWRRLDHAFSYIPSSTIDASPQTPSRISKNVAQHPLPTRATTSEAYYL